MNMRLRAPQEVPTRLRAQLLGRRVRVTEVAEVSPRIRRLVLRADDWAAPPGPRPAPSLTVQVGSLRNPRAFKRTYTVSRQEPDGALELFALAHGDGPGSALVRSLTVGDEVVVRGPEGGLALDATADFQLVTGDESALGSVAAIARALAPGTRLVVHLQSAGPVDRLRAALSLDHLRAEVSWTPAGPSERLVGAVAAGPLPSGRGAAWLLGELRSIQAVRNHLRSDRGWDRRQISTKPYWTPGRTGMD
ncbi:MAG: siderophore-interacting protein [Frankia sp.]